MLVLTVAAILEHSPWVGEVELQRYSEIIIGCTLFTAFQFPYLVDPLSAITTRAGNEGTVITSSLSDSDLAAAAAAASGKEVAMVFINSDSGEDYITVEGNEGDR